MYVTEDTTRARPDDREPLVLRGGARRRLARVRRGYHRRTRRPTGRGASSVRARRARRGGRTHIGIDWHGHRDRGMGLVNCLAAFEAGATRVHGTRARHRRALRQRGDRICSSSNLEAPGLDRPRPHRARRRTAGVASGRSGGRCPRTTRSSGQDAFETATGVHAAAVIKAFKKGDAWLADQDLLRRSRRRVRLPPVDPHRTDERKVERHLLARKPRRSSRPTSASIASSARRKSRTVYSRTARSGLFADDGFVPRSSVFATSFSARWMKPATRRRRRFRSKAIPLGHERATISSVSRRREPGRRSPTSCRSFRRSSRRGRTARGRRLPDARAGDQVAGEAGGSEVRGAPHRARLRGNLERPAEVGADPGLRACSSRRRGGCWISSDRGGCQCGAARFLVLDEAGPHARHGVHQRRRRDRAAHPDEPPDAAVFGHLSPEIKTLSERYLMHPETVRIDTAIRVKESVEHAFLEVPSRQKVDLLLAVLDRDRPAKCLVFTATREMTTELARRLRTRNHEVVSLSSLLSQANRERALTAFRNGGVRRSRRDRRRRARPRHRRHRSRGQFRRSDARRRVRASHRPDGPRPPRGKALDAGERSSTGPGPRRSRRCSGHAVRRETVAGFPLWTGAARRSRRSTQKPGRQEIPVDAEAAEDRAEVGRGRGGGRRRQGGGAAPAPASDRFFLTRDGDSTHRGGSAPRAAIARAARPGVAPDLRRVREALFNILGQDLSGFDVLDLYAGSGALGFEALSRGARRVVFVESNPKLAAALRRSAEELGVDRDVERDRGKSGGRLGRGPARRTRST